MGRGGGCWTGGEPGAGGTAAAPLHWLERSYLSDGRAAALAWRWCDAGKLVVAAATSGAVKSAVTSFAEEVLLKEQFVKLNELDVPYWAYWLSTTGYTSAVRRPPPTLAQRGDQHVCGGPHARRSPAPPRQHPTANTRHGSPRATGGACVRRAAALLCAGGLQEAGRGRAALCA